MPVTADRTIGAPEQTHFRAQLIRLCAAGAAAYCSYSMCRSPLLPLFARHLGASPQLVGFVSAASTLTGIVVKFPAGTLSDLWGRRTLLVAGAIVFAVMPFTYLGVTSLLALVMLRFVHGNATAIFGPVASAALSDLAPKDQRGTWLGTYAAIQSAGQALGPMIAGGLIVGGLFWPAFLVSGVIGCAAVLLALGWPVTPPTASGETRRLTLFRQGIAEVASDRRILTTSVAQASQFFLNGTMTAFLPLYAGEVIGLNAFEIGTLLGAQTLTTLGSRPLFGAMSDRVGRRPMIAAGLVICGLAALALSVTSTGSILLVIVMAYGAGLAITTSSTSAYVTDLARRARYGAAHGIFGTIYDIGDASGPIVAGLLVAAIGYAGMFRVMAAVTVTAALLFTIASRSWEQATA